MYHPIRFSRRFTEAWKTVNIRRNCIYLTMSFFFHLFSPLRNQPRFLARFRNLADGLKSWTLKFLSSLWVLSYKYYEASLEYHRTPYRHVHFFLSINNIHYCLIRPALYLLGPQCTMKHPSSCIWRTLMLWKTAINKSFLVISLSFRKDLIYLLFSYS